MTDPLDDLLTIQVDPDAEPAADVLDALADLLLSLFQTNDESTSVDPTRGADHER